MHLVHTVSILGTTETEHKHTLLFSRFSIAQIVELLADGKSEAIPGHHVKMTNENGCEIRLS